MRPALPVVKDSTWVRNPIDHFILAKLEAEKLKPAPVTIESEAPVGAYTLPSIELLETIRGVDNSKAQTDLEESSRVLEDTLRDFGIDAKVVDGKLQAFGQWLSAQTN